MVNDAWSRIADNMNIPVTNLKKKKESLMATYRIHRKKKIQSIKSGMGEDEHYNPIWPFYEPMDNFLNDVYECSSLINTVGNNKRRSSTFESVCCIFLCVVQLNTLVLANTQFASHVSVNTPARSFTHGVGDPISTLARRSYSAQRNFGNYRRPPYEQPRGGGYPRERPTIPFNSEDVRHGNSLGPAWQQLYTSFMDVSIPVLPPSPYKVDSPDPESLWPEGLFLPPISASRFGHSIARSDTDPEDDPLDPYLLEGSEAIAAVTRANRHGELYFHEIPHIESLLQNQELRTQNKLKPHRLGSIRHTWPYYRP